MSPQQEAVGAGWVGATEPHPPHGGCLRGTAGVDGPRGGGQRRGWVRLLGDYLIRPGAGRARSGRPLERCIFALRGRHP